MAALCVYFWFDDGVGRSPSVHVFACTIAGVIAATRPHRNSQDGGFWHHYKRHLRIGWLAQASLWLFVLVYLAATLAYHLIGRAQKERSRYPFHLLRLDLRPAANPQARLEHGTLLWSARHSRYRFFVAAVAKRVNHPLHGLRAGRACRAMCAASNEAFRRPCPASD